MTGSIEKRGKNSYRLVVFKGYDLDGKPIRHQKTVHCKNKSEAQIELAKFLTQVESVRIFGCQNNLSALVSEFF